MKKLLSVLLLIPTFFLLGCTSNIKNEESTSPNNISSTEQQNTKVSPLPQAEQTPIVNLEKPEITQLTDDSFWQDNPAIYQNWIAWEELTYAGTNSQPTTKILLLDTATNEKKEIGNVDEKINKTNPNFVKNKIIWLEAPYDSKTPYKGLMMMDLENFKQTSIGNFFLEANTNNYLIVKNETGTQLLDIASEKIMQIPQTLLEKFHGIYWINSNNDDVYFLTRDNSGIKNITIGEIEKIVLKLYKLNLSNYAAEELLNLGPQDEFIYVTNNNKFYFAPYDKETKSYEFYQYDLNNIDNKKNLFSFKIQNSYTDKIRNLNASSQFLSFTFDSISSLNEKNMLYAYNFENKTLYDILENADIEITSNSDFMIEATLFDQTHIYENNLVVSAYKKDEKNKTRTELEIFKISLPTQPIIKVKRTQT
ncbi:hypothetical protein JW911_04520 [Candidatus Peregrinibacteria bacterium]|nr:hypothetical protein [Candidatus Peregrinibacteria bacterium]